MFIIMLQFVDVNFELGTQYNKVVAPQDVALYGALCALASFDRADLKVRSCSQLHSRYFDYWQRFSVACLCLQALDILRFASICHRIADSEAA